MNDVFNVSYQNVKKYSSYGFYTHKDHHHTPLRTPSNHFLTIHQPQPPNLSPKTVSKLVSKELPKCNPFTQIIPYTKLIFVSLCLGVFVLNLFSLYFLCVLAVQLHFTLHFRRNAPLQPLQWRTSDKAADTGEPVAALSGISRDTTLHFVSIQRLHASVPPAIAAEVLQKLHKNCRKNLNTIP